jgi:MFS family permease
MEKSIWMACITHMFVEVFLLMQITLIPVFINDFNLSLLEVSLVATIPRLISLLFNIPVGILADKFGPNRLLFASMLIEGLACFLVSQTYNFWMLVLGASLIRISSPIYHVTGLSAISKTANVNKLSRAIGVHNAFGNLGSAAGLISLTVFLSILGWRWTYMFWSLPVIIWSFVILTSSPFKYKRNKKEEKLNIQVGKTKKLSLIFSSGLLIFLIALGFREIGHTGSFSFMTTYFVNSRGFSETLASLIFSLGPVLGIFGSLLGGISGERIGPKKTLTFIILSSALSLSILSLMTQLYPLILFFLIYSFLSSAVWSPVNTIVATITPKRFRGLSFSFYYLVEGLLATIAPTFAALVIGFTSIWFIFPFGIIFLISCVLLLQFLRHSKI